MTPEQRIEQNVKARSASNALIELGITMAREEGLSIDHVRLFWRFVMQTASELIGEVEPEPAEPDPPKEKPWKWKGLNRPHTVPSDDDPFPFGSPKKKGQTFGQVDDGYYSWLARQEWIEEHPRVLAYIQEHDLD